VQYRFHEYISDFIGTDRILLSPMGKPTAELNHNKGDQASIFIVLFTARTKIYVFTLRKFGPGNFS